MDETLLVAVDKKITESARRDRKAGKHGYIYLLSHILHFQDGSRYSGQGAKDGKYRSYWNRTNRTRVACEEIDQVIVDRIRSYLSDSALFSKLVEDAIKSRQTELPKVESEIRVLQANRRTGEPEPENRNRV